MPSCYTSSSVCPVVIHPLQYAQLLYILFSMPSCYTSSSVCPVVIHPLQYAQLLYILFSMPSCIKLISKESLIFTFSNIRDFLPWFWSTQYNYNNTDFCCANSAHCGRNMIVINRRSRCLVTTPSNPVQVTCPQPHTHVKTSTLAFNISRFTSFFKSYFLWVFLCKRHCFISVITRYDLDRYSWSILGDHFVMMAFCI